MSPGKTQSQLVYVSVCTGTYSTRDTCMRSSASKTKTQTHDVVRMTHNVSSVIGVAVVAFLSRERESCKAKGLFLSLCCEISMIFLRIVARTLGQRTQRTQRSAWLVATWSRMLNGRCFSTKLPGNHKDEDKHTQWIPPDRPLVGDKGSFHLSEHGDASGQVETTEEELDEEHELRQLELQLQREEGHQKLKLQDSNAQEQVDWLQTRRSKQWDAVDMMTPDLGTTKKWQVSDVAVIKYTLLTRNEINMCLTALGGKEITFLPNTPDRRMGDASGMILVTGSTPSQIFVLADTLVRQLKRRKLADVGVVGAMFGAEGSDDKFDTWRVVDCSNYIVHILDASTRRHLNLEALWSGRDASLRVNPNDEEAMDDYVAANPVPEGYFPNTQDWSSSISQMERNRWIVPHRPVAEKEPKGRKRRRGRR